MGEVMKQRQNEGESDDNESEEWREIKTTRRTSRQDKLVEGSKRKAENENDDEGRRVIV